MEVSGAAERIGLTLQRCRWLSADVIMVLVGLIRGITLFVEVGVVLLIPLAFSIAKKTNTSLLKLAIPLCTALMAVHCAFPTSLYTLPISWRRYRFGDRLRFAGWADGITDRWPTFP